jgi:diguanylate cyclase (GGDEF)-like protein
LLAALAALVADGPSVAPAVAAALVVCGAGVAATRSYRRRIAALERQAGTDALTGVANRLALDRQLECFLRMPSPRGALVFIDLDGFREVNRTRGHTQADQLLQAVGRALLSQFPDDLIARSGGDEFVLLVDRRRDPLAVAKHAINVVAGIGPDDLTLTATAGVAFIPEAGTTPDAVRVAADQALRWGKADGKARVVRYDAKRANASPEIGEKEIKALWLEDRIGIEVQPIVDLRAGRVRGYEALARFKVDGDRSPLRWFALADRMRLRAELEVACLQRALALFPDRPSGTHLTVNLSPDVLEVPDVRDAFRKLGDLRGLVLELTEDAVVDDYGRLSEQLKPYLAQGLRIAVDDFGTGQANLRHAWKLKPQYLKLARPLVTSLDVDDARRALVGSIVTYSERVGAAVIAEGVESAADLNALRSIGVPFAQGLRLAAPGPPWPAIDVDVLFPGEPAAVGVSGDPELLLSTAAETAGALQKRFVDSPKAIAAVFEGDGGRVTGLLTRNRLLVTLGVRFGFALYGDRPALAIADPDFMALTPGGSRDEVVARAMNRDESRRYDPILYVDEDGRLIGKQTIQELLEPATFDEPSATAVPDRPRAAAGRSRREITVAAKRPAR